MCAAAALSARSGGVFGALLRSCRVLSVFLVGGAGDGMSVVPACVFRLVLGRTAPTYTKGMGGGGNVRRAYSSPWRCVAPFWRRQSRLGRHCVPLSGAALRIYLVLWFALIGCPVLANQLGVRPADCATHPPIIVLRCRHIFHRPCKGFACAMRVEHLLWFFFSSFSGFYVVWLPPAVSKKTAPVVYEEGVACGAQMCMLAPRGGGGL